MVGFVPKRSAPVPDSSPTKPATWAELRFGKSASVRLRQVQTPVPPDAGPDQTQFCGTDTLVNVSVPSVVTGPPETANMSDGAVAFTLTTEPLPPPPPPDVI